MGLRRQKLRCIVSRYISHIESNVRRDSLALDLGQNQPAIVPAASTGRVSNNLPFGFVKAFGAEGVVFRHAPKFTKEVVGIDIVGPSAGHSFRHISRMVGREEFLDAA